MYLNNPNFLRLVFKLVYELQIPWNNRNAITNINCLQNILSSVKTASLVDQITGQDFQDMTYKCILKGRIDLYNDAWTKFAKNQEGDKPENIEDANVEQALKGLSISVTALKQASLTVA